MASLPPWTALVQDRRKLTACVIAGVLMLFSLFALLGGSGTHYRGPRPGGPGSKEGVTHIVAFKSTNTEALTTQMLALRDECTRDGRPYIRSVTGGKQSSPEGLDSGMQVVFVVEFENQDDADYYISDDPAHAAFKAAIKDYDPTATVFDFVPGVY